MIRPMLLFESDDSSGDVSLRDLFEVKLGGSDIELAKQNIIKFRDRINTDKMNKPSFVMMLTGTQYAFNDGSVHIVPISCLKN